MLESITQPLEPVATVRRPRLAFAGVGWIGRNRLEAIASSGLADIVAIYDAREEVAAEVAAKNQSSIAGSFEDLLGGNVDGIVIATPSALHAAQAIEALTAGKAVFCQKPLARNATETRRVVTAAREADRLLGVDFSYRFTAAMMSIRSLISSGALGNVYAVEMTFHNAYGPDKAWFFDRQLSGGGCLLDLGIHLVDLALWTLGASGSSGVSGLLRCKDQRWSKDSSVVEDYAAAQFATNTGASVQLACSWHAVAGVDAMIEAIFYGTQGGARFANVGGTFYHFIAEQMMPDRSKKTLTVPPDDWSGGATLNWLNQLSRSKNFDPGIESAVAVAETIDEIYGSAAQP
jgi:predicted dehydrogenase